MARREAVTIDFRVLRDPEGNLFCLVPAG